MPGCLHPFAAPDTLRPSVHEPHLEHLAAAAPPHAIKLLVPFVECSGVQGGARHASQSLQQGLPVMRRVTSPSLSALRSQPCLYISPATRTGQLRHNSALVRAHLMPCTYTHCWSSIACRCGSGRRSGGMPRMPSAAAPPPDPAPAPVPAPASPCACWGLICPGVLPSCGAAPPGLGLGFSPRLSESPPPIADAVAGAGARALGPACCRSAGPAREA